jgi:hypothetical protein
LAVITAVREIEVSTTKRQAPAAPVIGHGQIEQAAKVKKATKSSKPTIVDAHSYKPHVFTL